MLQGKKIIIGVCGSIAAYKTALLIRLLKKQQAEVKVIMTSTACEFITPLTLSTLSENPVLSEFNSKKTGEWNNHIELGLWADALIIAPASANTIAKMANGICDNLLIAIYLSARCPVHIAPAMDLDMYTHPSTSANIQKLSEFGNQIIEAEYGELASGLIGKGRMSEPEHIVSHLQQSFNKKALEGKKVLITAGPTYEALDPVRFIGNHSSGKMGYALAEAAANQGAKVRLVSGPSREVINNRDIELVRVTSAEEMFLASKEAFSQSDISILAAAVADYKPAEVTSQKIKKTGDTMALQLIKTRDIAESLGKLKKKTQLMIGFALETENEIENARKKILSKNFDLIVVNSLNDPGAGFGFDTNKISILDKENNIRKFELKSKKEVAQDIINSIIDVI